MSQPFREWGGSQGGQGDSNEEDPSLPEHGRVREECAKGSRVPGGEGSWCQAAEVVGHL